MSKISNSRRDPFGPEYAIKVYDPQSGMRGFLVIDNTVLGPGKGGIRMTADVTMAEVSRLARTMTWKNSLAGIPFDGAKAGIVWPGGDDNLKKQFIQSFARAIKPLTPGKYIAGPDVNTSEREMQWFVEATGNWRSATGKPARLCMLAFGKKGEKCGIPHEYGSTGFGVVKAAEIAAELLGWNMAKQRIAIHGFGNVGTFVYKYLTELNAKVVAIADYLGAVYAPDGFNQNIINRLIKDKTSISQYPGAKKITAQDFWSVDADILIPASVTDVINETNKDKIKAKMIVEAANIPMKEAVEQELFNKGVVIIPDFVANAGGVISSYAEYRGYNPKRMFAMVEKKISQAARLVLAESLKTKVNPRQVALKIAQARVAKQE